MPYSDPLKPRPRRSVAFTDAELLSPARRGYSLTFDERVRLAKLQQDKRDARAAAQAAKRSSRKRRRRS